MRIENAFDVAAPSSEVYALMLDPARVAPCIPGAEVVGAREDGSYDAKVTVKVGPMKMSYAGVVAIVEHDDAARTAAMRARGVGGARPGQRRCHHADGRGRARQRRIHVDVSTEMQVTGRVAQMGQGIMQDVAVRMIGEMARNMEALLAPAAPAANAETACPAGRPRRNRSRASR